MKLSEISQFEQIIVEKIINNKIWWDICFGVRNKEEVECMYKEYGENFKLYKIEFKDIKLNSRDMIRCYMEKIQQDINKETNGMYNVNENITSFITEQEYSILDYIFKNLLSRVEDNFYQDKGEEIEIDI